MEPTDLIAEMNRIMRPIAELEAEYLAKLTELASGGATDEQIATVAIDRRTKMLSAFIGFGAPGSWGATAADLGRAVVEALHHCGRLRDVWPD